MNEDRAERAAVLLLDARRNGEGLAGFPPDCAPRSIADAYAIQDAVSRRLGRAVGWKTGAPSPEAEPAFAPIHRVMPSPARFPSADQRLFGIEAEVAFRIARDLPSRAAPYSRDEAIGAIAHLHPVIELVDTRFADWSAVDGLSKIADNQSNGALIFGAPVAAWRGLDLVRPPLTLTIDGAVAATTLGNNGGEPLRLFTGLVNHAAQHGEGLKAGDLVTTGSLMGVVFAGAGAAVVADFAALGRVELTFSA
jgi:2-keto-4-pentenoate hydratase